MVRSDDGRNDTRGSWVVNGRPDIFYPTKGLLPLLIPPPTTTTTTTTTTATIDGVPPALLPLFLLSLSELQFDPPFL